MAQVEKVTIRDWQSGQGDEDPCLLGFILVKYFSLLGSRILNIVELLEYFSLLGSRILNILILFGLMYSDFDFKKSSLGACLWLFYGLR